MGIGTWFAPSLDRVFYVLDTLEHCAYNTVVFRRKRHGRRRPQRFAGTTLKVGDRVELPSRCSHWVIEMKRRS